MKSSTERKRERERWKINKAVMGKRQTRERERSTGSCVATSPIRVLLSSHPQIQNSLELIFISLYVCLFPLTNRRNSFYVCVCFLSVGTENFCWLATSSINVLTPTRKIKIYHEWNA